MNTDEAPGGQLSDGSTPPALAVDPPQTAQAVARANNEEGQAGRTPESVSEPNAQATLDTRHAQGTWAIRSASTTVYYLDLDRRLLLRTPGPGSSTGPYDHQWVALVDVDSLLGDGIIRIGERPCYFTDPDASSDAYRWWVQRTVTWIERLDVAPGGPRKDNAE
ncbi:hypothetical protein [Cellulomonas sp. Leaf334]|uniref:hypothetical protein n=1 Tax=Cellulomonas sp. Leaf334 TaxID=1736339 RepID=UPI00138F5DB7|nr:hypothetical protein [Cellulomonas sp. Leaf334]